MISNPGPGVTLYCTVGIFPMFNTNELLVKAPTPELGVFFKGLNQYLKHCCIFYIKDGESWLELNPFCFRPCNIKQYYFLCYYVLFDALAVTQYALFYIVTFNHLADAFNQSNNWGTKQAIHHT